MQSALRIAPSNPTRAFKRVWELGFNTCHAPLVMRSDLQKHLRIAYERLGMKYWRCHGTLGDDVALFGKDASGSTQHTFGGLKRIIDAALATGVRPFMELSFMPGFLARDSGSRITHYSGITSPPKDFAQWGELIGSVVGFLADTYGLAELQTWYFEVWNEPNIKFWAGTQAEYFELYRHAALAIKKVDARLRVGGPATARGVWVKEMLAFTRDTRTPLDFVSTHIYPSDVAFIESDEGEVKRLGIEFLHESFRRVRQETDGRAPRLPVIWGEWNSSAGPFTKNHDDANNAAFVAAALAGIEEYGDGSLYWNLSDIYEEAQYHFAPFHGGYGLFTVDDIPKSAARAFELFHRLGAQQLAVMGLPESPVRGALAGLDAERGSCTCVLWHHDEPGNNEREAWDVEIEIAGAKSAGDRHTVSPGAGSAYETWREMGAPGTLTPAQHRQLLDASIPAHTPVCAEGGRFRLSLAPGELTLLSVTVDKT